ncbi:hypothetical protein CLOM_g21249 [Closterium sp. NIES-68]|nr:hypothetical protein CLOM_g21249 [Closterium sp. NIES-68]GJP70557.1 hypothetical protein CLOP_g1483 [Closterium sp. NIES-67]
MARTRSARAPDGGGGFPWRGVVGVLAAVMVVGSLPSSCPALASPQSASARPRVSRPLSSLRNFLAYHRGERVLAARQCGACCSASPGGIPRGMPAMVSTWYQQTWLTGQRVQLKASTFGTWWRVDGLGKAGSTISSRGSGQPSVREYFLVVVVGAYRVKLLTRAGTYVAVAGSTPKGYSSPPLVTTASASSPATVFQVSRIGRFSYLYSPFARSFVRSRANGQVTVGGTNRSNFGRMQVVEVKAVPAVRGVNLGSWLVYEQWMDPNAFPRYSNILDGTKMTLFNYKVFKYVTAPQGGGGWLRCDADLAGDFETFIVQTQAPNQDAYHLLAEERLYWHLPATAAIPYADAFTPSARTRFQFRRRASDRTMVAIVAPNGRLLQALSDGTLIANYSGNLNDPAFWNGPAAFRFTPLKELRYDWQLAYQWGSQAAMRINSQRSTFVTEADWRAMARQGVNAVRIPIAYYMAQEPSPDWPFVWGSYMYIDWAFKMAVKYKVRIWFSMHVVAGTQSGTFGSRLGYVDFPRPRNVAKTLGAIRWLAQRYGRHPMWLGIGLMNEPSLSVPLDLLKSYYVNATAIIRRWNPCVYISMEGQTGPDDVQSLMAGEPNVILESHVYDVFSPGGYSSAQQEIYEMQTSRKERIAEHQQYGRMLLVGEFSNAMGYSPVTPDEQTAFSLAQMQTLGTAKAGWFFWSLKINKPNTKHWDFYQSQLQGWLPKRPNGHWY